MIPNVDVFLGILAFALTLFVLGLVALLLCKAAARLWKERRW